MVLLFQHTKGGIKMSKEYIYGTVIERQKDGPTGLEFLNGIFNVTSGLMLSQVREITGIDSPALQNWINRGWVSRPVNKKYNIDQVSRIIIINVLRSTMKLENIDFLLHYINGNLDCRDDDIICESQLFDYICKIIDKLKSQSRDLNSEKIIENCIEEVISEYKEIIPGAKKRLSFALKIIINSYIAVFYKRKAEEMLSEIKN